MTRPFHSIDPVDTPWQSRLLWTVSPPVVRGLGRVALGLRVDFESDLPAPPFVIASNHYSHFDPALVGAVVRHPVRFLALEDLLGANRLLDWLIEGYGSIPTPRARSPVSAVRTAMRALEAGDVVGLFPEATRVSHWGTLRPRRGAAWLAERVGVPIVPVAVVGTGRALGLDNRLHRFPVRVIVGAPLEPAHATVDELTRAWSGWVSDRIGRHPESEPAGPPRAFVP